MSKPLVIETMYAFVADNDGDEGIIGLMTPDGWLPLVGADLERVESLRGIAQDTANKTGRKVTLVHFEKRTDVETIEPDGSGKTNMQIVDFKGGQ